MNKNFAKTIASIWPFRILYRITVFIPYVFPRLLRGFSWSLKRTEVSNFYYDLTQKNLQELANVIAFVAKIEFSQASAYLEEVRTDTDLAKHIQSTLSVDKSMADSTMLLGRRLGWYAMVRALKPKVVIETGVHQGIGAVTIIRALEMNAQDGFPGKYYGTDIDPKAGVLVTGKFLETGKILFGDSISSLESLTEEVDIFINDSDHSAVYEAREYETIKYKLRKNSVILGDNSHATSALVDYSIKNNRQFLLFREEPLGHWYPGAGIGISF
jgi:predicted O-methyltransferase YrrM